MAKIEFQEQVPRCMDSHEEEIVLLLFLTKEDSCHGLQQPQDFHFPQRFFAKLKRMKNREICIADFVRSN